MSIKVLELTIESESWVIIYLEPNNRWSEGGGRITVNIGDDYLGSYFFSHVGPKTFEDFIANCGEDYLVGKLFKTKEWIPVEDTTELFQCVAREHVERIKQARYSGLEKTKLRKLYKELKTKEFSDLAGLLNNLDDEDCETMAWIFGDDWWYESLLTKRNHVYDWHMKVIQNIQARLKLKACA